MPDNDKHTDHSDLFTRLSIAMCDEDDGTRPVDPSWEGSDIGWLSPVISFSQYPIPAAQETEIYVHIRNFGTVDATGVFLEVVYNIEIGNQWEANIPIQNVTLPMIPAGGDQTATIPWTPPDTESTHGCVRARVFDVYSLTNYADRCTKWASAINPQAGQRNARLVPIEDETKPVVITFMAKNFFSSAIRTKVLVTRLDQRARHRSIYERYPIPFRPELTTGARSTGSERNRGRVLGSRIPRLGRVERTARGTILPATTLAGLWPRDSVDESLIHNEFGFETDGRLSRPRAVDRLGSFHLGDALPAIRSFIDVELEPDEEKEIYLVIPPDKFPARGMRKVFKIDYQVGVQRPVQHFVYLSR